MKKDGVLLFYENVFDLDIQIIFIITCAVQEKRYAYKNFM